MKTTIRGTINDIIITPKHLKSLTLSFAAEMNTPMREPKKITPEMMNIHPYKSTMIISPIFGIIYIVTSNIFPSINFKTYHILSKEEVLFKKLLKIRFKWCLDGRK